MDTPNLQKVDMMEGITQRIVEIISTMCKGNRSDFARKLNFSPAYASQLYSGERIPSERTISDICRVFDVREEWLKEGIAPMRLNGNTDNVTDDLPEIDMAIGERLRVLRSKYIPARTGIKLTQSDMAEELGLSRNYIAMIENGDRIPSKRTVNDICRIYQVRAEWLQEGVGEPFLQEETAGYVKQEPLDIKKRNAAFKTAFIESIIQLPDEDFDMLVSFWLQVAEKMKEKNGN